MPNNSKNNKTNSISINSKVKEKISKVDSNGNENAPAVYGEINHEIRHFREAEWKQLHTLSLFFLGIFSALIAFSGKENFGDIVTSIRSIRFYTVDPLQIAVILIAAIGLWGFITMLSIKLRFPPMFFTLKTLHLKLNSTVFEPEVKSDDKLESFRWLYYIYNFGHLAWIPTLAFLDIVLLAMLSVMNFLWWLIPFLIYFAFCGFTLFNALRFKRGYPCVE